MSENHPIRRYAQLGVALVGGLLALSAAPGIWIGVFGYEGWGVGSVPLFAGFEIVILLAGITAVLIGVLPRRDGFGLAGLCVAGGLFASTILGAIILENSSPAVPSLKWAVLLRLGGAGLIGGLTGLVKLGNCAQCWRKLILGSVLVLPVVAAAGLFVGGKLDLLTGLYSGMGIPVRMSLWILTSVIVGAMAIAGGHFLIRAFELTRESLPEKPAAPNHE